MTTTSGCPSCGTPLTGAPVCASCGLPLVGTYAARLWQVDQQLAGLESTRVLLGAERADLLQRLRAGETEPSDVGQRWSALPPPAGTWPAPGQRPHAETHPQRVQNTLLALGALLLALAALVFTAVTYRHLGVVGRALVLLVLTGAAAWAPSALRRRGLTSSAEAVGAIAVVLTVLDVVALRRAGFGQDVDSRTYYAVALAVVSALVAGWSRLVPVRVAQLAWPLLAQLPVPFVLARVDASLPVVGTVLGAQALVDLVVAVRTRLPALSRAVAGAAAVPLCLVALSVSAQAVRDDDHAAGAGMLAVAVVLAVASLLASQAVLQTVAAVPVVPLLGAAAVASVRFRLTDAQLPLVLVAVALMALPVAAYVPAVRRQGPVLSALTLTGVTLLVELQAVGQAVGGPFLWLGDPWTRTASSAREALGPHLVWDGTVVTLVVLAGAGVAAVVGGLLLEEVQTAVPVAGVLLVLAAVTMPLGFATSYRDALLLELVVALALAVAAGAVLHRQRLVGVALAASAAAVAVLDAVWSTADEDSTLTVLPLAALVVAGLALLLPGVLTGVALLLGGAELAAYGASRELSVDQVGALVVVAVAVAVAASFVLPGRHRLGAEAAALVLGATSVVLSAPDPGWLSWVLVADGLLALAVSVRPDRRHVGILGGALLVGSSWVRLLDAHVEAPEPYVAPLAAAALVLGHLRRRVHAGLDSMQAYAGGLTLALGPSLVKSFADTTPTRGLLLLLVAVGVVVVGARFRLRAPLVVGGAVVVLDGLNLLGPYAASVPRWLLLGLLGLLLVVLGATYEQRLRELQRLRDRYLRLG